MGYGERTFVERDALYEAVWADPVTVVAKRYGLSDVGLHKLCKRLSVPVPPRGYWARLRAGQQVKRIPLPPTTGPTRDHIAVKPAPAADAPEKPVRLAFLPEEERASVLKVCNTVQVKVRLVNPHPLIVHDREARKLWEKREREHQRAWDAYIDGGPPPPSYERITGFLDMRVSDEQWQRGYRVLDALFRAIEALGGSVRAEDRIIAVILKEPVKFRIRSKGDMLILVLEEWTAPRTTWQEGKRKRIEAQLGDFIVSLYEFAHTRRTEREERARAEERRRAEAQRLRERAKVQEAELARYTAFENAALDWEKARTLERYTSELERRASGETNPDRREKLRQQVEWARAKVAWVDPFVAADDPVLGKRRHDQPEGSKVVLEKPPSIW